MNRARRSAEHDNTSNHEPNTAGLGNRHGVNSAHGLNSDDLETREVKATKHKTEITIETHRVLIINRRKVSSVSLCDQCGWRVRMIQPEVAALWAGVSTRQIYRWHETRELHFLERPDGLSLVCLKSLGELLNRNGAPAHAATIAKGRVDRLT